MPNYHVIGMNINDPAYEFGCLEFTKNYLNQKYSPYQEFDFDQFDEEVCIIAKDLHPLINHSELLNYSRSYLDGLKKMYYEMQYEREKEKNG